ncbi:alpha-D-ribose 1-methylphosphonate 5-triphosphate diphosphatase [Paenibacillus harenae]|uniref:Alpha-D-ribose 1-methylphosphonate 5-triphosphate diphosphatase n=1 Tax=Paenibacillus harenae TaxID=306543 RepID=A0ABT9TVT8_PAEHA|nr:alpha-D-ribose 1-methylphosphonate 5-triphosphate diphosphatase [Paenibacillus harenae]MDQ0111207.1 alpha-D-ribose 1-methylphosphonate 5-triphosphate diphosphatase [Paenibacillus harenae]
MDDKLLSGSESASGPVMIKNGQVVLEDRITHVALTLAGGRIQSILEEPRSIEDWVRRNPQAFIIDANQSYVLPGLIDIHCDAIEKEIQPRPNTLFPLPMALIEFERKLPLHGITTMYHSLSLGVGLSLRGDHLLTEMVELIDRYRTKRSVVRNRIHLRYEVSHLAGLPIVERYLRNKQIHYLSFMDHSPGQGQYRKPGSFERYVMKNQGVDHNEVHAIVDDLAKRREQVDWGRLNVLGNLALQNGIAIASHDIDSRESIDQSASLGVKVCEFPINLETASYAVGRGLRVCVGAPNIVRGASHDNNLRAVDAISIGAADILCSDYHPSSMLAAVFKLADEGIAALPQAVRMASLHPAEALGTEDELGSIKPGKAADLIIVDRYEKLPWVTHAIVGGSIVYSACIRY